jgi:four helix bundle protein
MGVERLAMYRLASAVGTELRNAIRSWPMLDQRSLGDQLLRSADSVTHNIAEMDARISTGEKLQFLNIAEGSLQEARSAVVLAVERDLLTSEAGASLRRRLSGVSFQMLAFAAALLERDPDYSGRYRAFVERRRHTLRRLRPQPPEDHHDDIGAQPQ